jgi:hypothetical protein
MPTPKISTDAPAPSSRRKPEQTSLIESEPPATPVVSEVVESSTPIAPEVVWVDEDRDLFYEVMPNGDRRFVLPLRGDEFTVRAVTIGDVIDLEKSIGSISELGLEAYCRLLARLTTETTFPFEGGLLEKVAQIKKGVPTEPDLALASRALMHAGEADADPKADGVDVDIEVSGDLPIKIVTLPVSGIVVRLRTEMTQDSTLIAQSMGGQQAFDKRPIEAFAARVARLCVGWGNRPKITSSDVKELRFGADFHALNKALRFFRKPCRAGS